MKKHSEAMQTLHARCSKADPQTNKHTNKHTDRADYNTLRSLACSVINKRSHKQTGAITIHCTAASLALSVNIINFTAKYTTKHIITIVAYALTQ